jgi:folate-dependent phosphoribosylglycinamide formyltransferase PurN
MRFAVITSTRYSKYALLILKNLLKFETSPYLVLAERLYSRKNLKKALRKYGGFSSLVQKIKGQYEIPEYEYLQKELLRLSEETSENSTDIKMFCNNHNIMYSEVWEINGHRTAESIRKHKIDYLIYAGGGLLKENLIDSVNVAILNCHSGPLPHVRGMNAAEWTICEGLPPEITIHCIDKGVDTGAIIKKRTNTPFHGMSLDQFRGLTAARCARTLAEEMQFLSQGGQLTTYPNNTNEGKTYYRMHPIIRSQVEGLLNEYRPSDNKGN